VLKVPLKPSKLLWHDYNRNRKRGRKKEEITVALTPKARGARVPQLYKWLGTGAPWVEQHVLITKALTETTNCTIRAIKRRGMAKKVFSCALRRTGAPTFKFDPAPLGDQRHLHEFASVRCFRSGFHSLLRLADTIGECHYRCLFHAWSSLAAQ